MIQRINTQNGLAWRIKHASPSMTDLSVEWLLTNHSGSYSFGTAESCNTRRYHGLYVRQTGDGREMLLSAVEDELHIRGKIYPLSSRVHPGCFWPEGRQYLIETAFDPDNSPSSVTFIYSIPLEEGSLLLHKQIILREDYLEISYFLPNQTSFPQLEDIILTVKPLLAFRNVNYLLPVSAERQMNVRELKTDQNSICSGCSVSFRNSTAYMFIPKNNNGFFNLSEDWYYHILYPVEKERGYDYDEDLFTPGTFRLALRQGKYTPLVFTDQNPSSLDSSSPAQVISIPEQNDNTPEKSLLLHLKKETERFFVSIDDNLIVPAGYPWFGPWGRDTLISLPGLTFADGRTENCKEILRQISGTVKNGLLPNLFGIGNAEVSYNSADASLWYILAVHRFYIAFPDELEFILQQCLPVIKNILSFFKSGTMPDQFGMRLVYADDDGLLHVGSRETQLTWMDASIDGIPVTPRFGCPVELNALWYDALSFAKILSKAARKKIPETEILPSLAKAFNKAFVPQGEDADKMDGGLFDTWNPEGPRDYSIRPNQIFAAAVPCSPLTKNQILSLIACVKKNLLTPYGLRTLASQCPEYHGQCRGSQPERDKAYHQGTIWPWLLGAYADAVVKAKKSSMGKELLDTITPLLQKHMDEAGLGGISEILDGDFPHTPGGCTTQAWSVAELYRLLLLIKASYPKAWKDYFASLA